MTLLEKLNRVPPCACRLFARDTHGRRSPSHRDLAVSCGVGKTFIAELSYKTSWNGVPVEVASKFMAACGVDPDKPWEVKRFLRRAKKYHIVNAHPRKKEMFLRILKGDPRSMKAGSGNGAV